VGLLSLLLGRTFIGWIVAFREINLHAPRW